MIFRVSKFVMGTPVIPQIRGDENVRRKMNQVEYINIQNLQFNGGHDYQLELMLSHENWLTLVQVLIFSTEL